MEYTHSIDRLYYYYYRTIDLSEEVGEGVLMVFLGSKCIFIAFRINLTILAVICTSRVESRGGRWPIRWLVVRWFGWCHGPEIILLIQEQMENGLNGSLPGINVRLK